MTLSRAMTRFGLVAVAVLLLLGMGLAFAGSASAESHFECENNILLGHSPAETGGWGTFAACSEAGEGVSLDDVIAATECDPDTVVIFHNAADGRFLAFIPGSDVDAVNAEFVAYLTGGEFLMPEGTIFLARC